MSGYSCVDVACVLGWCVTANRQHQRRNIQMYMCPHKHTTDTNYIVKIICWLVLTTPAHRQQHRNIQMYIRSCKHTTDTNYIVKIIWTTFFQQKPHKYFNL